MTDRGLKGRRVTINGRLAGTIDTVTPRGFIVRHSADGEKRWWPREVVRFVKGDYTK